MTENQVRRSRAASDRSNARASDYERNALEQIHQWKKPEQGWFGQTMQQVGWLDTAQVVRDEAAAAADVAERRAEHARAVLPTARSVAERAADRAADTAGDAAFARTFATGAWVLAGLSLGWAGIRRRAVLRGGFD